MRLCASRTPLLTILAVFAGLVMAAPAASAAVGQLNLRRPLSAWGSSERAGLRASAPSAAALALSVEQTTGLQPSQVTTEGVCGTPQPGHAACAAEALVLRSDHARIHPHVRAGRTFTQVFPRRRKNNANTLAQAGTASPATSSASAAPPSPGTPAYLQQAYDLSYLSQTAGATDTIAIIDAYDDANAETDLGVYRTQYGLSPCTTSNGCFRKVNENGAASPLPNHSSSWEQEESLDLDAVSALCPNCHLLLVEANSSSIADLDTAITTAIGMGADQISNSWTVSGATPQGSGSFPGQTIIAGTGDHGYLGAGTDNYPAAFPGVTAVGGTTLSAASAGSSLRGFSESAWSLNSNATGWGATSGCDTSEPKPSWQTDSGCTGRSYADLSADANPETGLNVYDSGEGGWLVMGGTSLATPLVAAFEALTGVNGTTAQWAYADSGLLNDPTSGSSGTCAQAISYICNAGPGYDGPTGVGSISGDIVAGGPGVGAPGIGDGSGDTYAQSVGTSTATLIGGVYPNGVDTSYSWQYGTTTAYGQQTASVDAGSSAAPVAATGSLTGLTPGLTYHYRLVATNSDGTSYGYDYALTTSALTNAPPVDTAAPSISGSALQGQTLIASPGSWTAAPGTFNYQWQRSTDGGATWNNVSGATSSSYQVGSSDLGARLQVAVTATNSYGTGTATSAPIGPVGSGAPAVTSPPAASGSPDQGQLLSAVSSWSPAGSSYTYQWQSSSDGGTSWTDLAGATGSTYQLSVTDMGNEIRVQITAVNSYGQTVADSPAVGPIVANAPINTSVPTVSGSDQRTDTLTATAGAWSGTGVTYTYEWQRSPDGTTWTGIENADQPTYTLGPNDEGDSVRVLVTATNANGAASTPSAGTPIVAPYPPANTVAPAFTGSAVRGTILNASQGTWTGPDNVYAYQWQRDFGEGYVNIVGATAADYTLGVADEGATVRVVVSATDPDATISVPSAGTAMVAGAPPLNQSAPTITGTVQRGVTLGAGVGTWSGVGNAYTYQWQSSPDATTWTAIAGATASTYTVAQSDEGNELRVLITATNPDGTVTVPSPASAPAAGAPPLDTVAPTIGGTAQRGTTLGSISGTWTGAGNAYALQWQRSANGTTWTNIAGATGGTYTLQVADEADYVRLLVTASNPDGTFAAGSQPTALVLAAPPVNTASPVVSGTVLRSSNLTASVGTFSGIGNSYSCQWQRSTDGGNTWTSISAATGWGYTVAVADEGAQLRALISATNADGTVSAASSPTSVVTGAPPVNASTPTISGAALRGSTLSSTEGGWSGIGNAYSFQWQRSANGTTWTNITGATLTSYTLQVADEGDEVRLQVTVTNPDATVSVASSPTGTVASSLPTNTALPSVSGSPMRGLTLISAQGTWGGIGDTFAYQWQRSADGSTWTNITGATGANYTAGTADEGDVLRVSVTAANGDGSVTAASPATATVTATPPVDTTLPIISGSAQRSQMLSSSGGTWLGVGNAYSYQWQGSTNGTTWTNIAGATQAAYQVAIGDEGSQLRVTITATNPDGSSTAASAPTTTVPAAPPVSLTAPAVAGTAQRGFMLSSTPGTWSGIGNSLAYQWQVATDGTTWTDVVGATGTTLTLGLGDEGDTVRLQVTASNVDGIATASSTPTATVTGSPPANTVAPTIAGIAVRGNSLSSTAGTFSGSGNAISEQWQRSANGTTWTNISQATGPAYTLQVADEGDTVRLVVTALNPDGTVSVPSPATATVVASPPVDTTAPSIAGTARRTATLTGTAGVWVGAGDVLTYQWQRSADSGTTWTPITGATAASYTLQVADEGDVVRMVVSATNADGTVSAGSAPSAPVLAAAPLNSGLPTILGTPRLGATLLAQTGTWSPSDVTYTYAWQRGDPVDGFRAIAGATGSSYTLAAADVGETVRVVVTATNPDGTTSATSGATSTVAQPPVNLIAPAAPTGTLMAGDVLTPTNGTWDSPSTYAYTWLRCPAGATAVTASCTSIAGGSTYTLGNGDVGSEIAVTVTATSVGGSASAGSALTGAVAGALLTNTAPPSIIGNPQVPNTLYAAPGTWSVPLNSVSYIWDRCDPDGVSNCTQVVANSAHYTLSGADSGHAIVLIADVTSPGRSASAQSPPLTIQNQPLPQVTVIPTVSGTTIRTHTLSATGGSWTNSPTSLSYQWDHCDTTGRNCQAVPGATQTTYQLSSADEGDTIAVTVTAANASGANSATSAATGVVTALLPVALQPPGISQLGVQQGIPVNVGGATWQTTSGTTYTTVWERCNAGGAACQAITGATASSYTPVAADVGHTLVAVITAADVDGTVSSASPPTDVVLPAAPRWRDLPVLTATSGVVGGTLTITPGVWTGPAVTTDTPQVMRCTSSCVVVGSGASYTIASADVGAILRVRETAANAGGSTVVWSAQYVGPVASAGSATAVLLSGQAVLRNSAGAALAVAQVSASSAVTSDIVTAAGAVSVKRGGATVRQVRIRRAAHVRGTLRAWVCPVTAGAGPRGAAPPACTRQITLRASAVVKLPASMTGRLRIVVVRRSGH